MVGAAHEVETGRHWKEAVVLWFSYMFSMYLHVFMDTHQCHQTWAGKSPNSMENSGWENHL